VWYPAYLAEPGCARRKESVESADSDDRRVAFLPGHHSTFAKEIGIRQVRNFVA